MQEKQKRVVKKLAATPKYVSPGQLTLAGFESPFERHLDSSNRWITLSSVIPWDKIVPYYDRLFGKEGRPPISGRVIIGAMIIKHIEELTDRSTILHIEENLYMQYFLGYSSFTHQAPFTAPLFVSIRKRMTLELTSKISEVIAGLSIEEESDQQDGEDPDKPVAPDNKPTDNGPALVTDQQNDPVLPKPQGKLIMDATVAPQHIPFPTDLKVISEGRQMSERLIDKLYDAALHGPVKPRTYRNTAQKLYLLTAKKKAKSVKVIYKANGQQLRFLRRNLRHIEALLTAYPQFPLKHKDLKYLMVLYTVYEQQEQMWRTHTKSIEHRIVNIHQPHVRPIPRGKDRAKIEFGAKLQVSLVGGFTYIDKLSWEALNEGTCLKDSVLQYKKRFGYYPAQVLADKIYCNRENRRWLKELDIKLAAKPLGRPSATAVADHVRPGDRNPIEGKFGQAKLAYGLDLIKAKLQNTSESWIACIALVLNLVNLTRKVPLSLYQKIMAISLLLNVKKMTFYTPRPVI